MSVGCFFYFFYFLLTCDGDVYASMSFRGTRFLILRSRYPCLPGCPHAYSYKIFNCFTSFPSMFLVVGLCCVVNGVWIC